MSLQWSFLSQNTTVVYNSLNISAIDINDAKALLGDQGIVTSMPELLVLVDPTVPIVIQFGSSRLRVTCQRKGNEIFPMVYEKAIVYHHLVKDQSTIAYGFNFEFQFTLPESDANLTISQLFTQSLAKIEPVIGSKIQKFIPRLTYSFGDSIVDLIIEPIDKTTVIAQANFHYPATTLPDSSKLGSEFNINVNHIIETIEKVFA